MSRCICNAILTPQEMCRKDANGEYETLCTKCLKVAGVLECEESLEGLEQEDDDQ